MIKLIGALIVVSSSAYIGLGIGYGLRQRVKNLRGILRALGVMKREISELLTPLGEIMEILRKEGGEESEIFKRCGIALKDGLGGRFEEEWGKAIDETRWIRLSEEDRELMKELGRVLGRYEPEQQKQAIERVEEQLRKNLEKAEEEMRIKGRISAAMGVSAGIMVAIILV